MDRKEPGHFKQFSRYFFFPFLFGMLLCLICEYSIAGGTELLSKPRLILYLGGFGGINTTDFQYNATYFVQNGANTRNSAIFNNSTF